MAKYVPTYNLTAVIEIREDLAKRIGERDEAQRDAIRILLESRFSGFRIAGFRITEVKVQ
jgi:hypothetical protein